MHKKALLIMIATIGGLLLNGCATTYSQRDPVYLSTNESNTGIIIKFSRNMGQAGVIGHVIKIDDNDEIQVEPVSELKVFLTPGTHKLRIISISSLQKSTWYPYPRSGKNDRLFYFGKPVEEGISLNMNEIKTLKFTAPFIGTVRGKLEVR